jgi:hypothetical protein
MLKREDQRSEVEDQKRVDLLNVGCRLKGVKRRYEIPMALEGYQEKG